MTESEKSTLKNQASTIQNEVNEGSNTAQRVGQMFNRVIDAVPITTQEVTEESTTVPSNSAVGKKFENSFNERITSSLTEDTNKVPSNKAVYDFINKRIVGEIALEDLDKLSTSATTYFVGTAPVFLIVKKGTIIVGILQVFTDDMRHVVTQVFTTHYALVNGSFGSAHIDTKVFTYYRSYSISSPNIPTGTWSAWKKTEEAFTGFFECSTPATTGTKTITINGFTLDTNCRLVVKMTNSNTAANATLNINSTGAIPLFYNGERASASNYWEAGEVLDIYYDGTNFQASNIQGGAGEGGNMILTFTTDVATTRKSVKDKFRRAGLVIAYKNASGEWVNEQYIGTTFTDAQWQLDSNWQKIASNKDVTDGIKGAFDFLIVDWNTDVATTRKSVPSDKRKAGLIISYDDSENGRIDEQYLSANLTEAEWEKNTNWQRIIRDRDTSFARLEIQQGATSAYWRTEPIPVTPGQQIEVFSNSSESNTSSRCSWLDADGKDIGALPSISINTGMVITVPEDAYYIVVRSQGNKDRLSLRYVTPLDRFVNHTELKISELQRDRKFDKAIGDLSSVNLFENNGTIIERLNLSSGAIVSGSTATSICYIPLNAGKYILQQSFTTESYVFAKDEEMAVGAKALRRYSGEIAHIIIEEDGMFLACISKQANIENSLMLCRIEDYFPNEPYLVNKVMPASGYPFYNKMKKAFKGRNAIKDPRLENGVVQYNSLNNMIDGSATGYPFACTVQNIANNEVRVNVTVPQNSYSRIGFSLPARLIREMEWEIGDTVMFGCDIKNIADTTICCGAGSTAKSMYLDKDYQFLTLPPKSIESLDKCLYFQVCFNSPEQVATEIDARLTKICIKNITKDGPWVGFEENEDAYIDRQIKTSLNENIKPTLQTVLEENMKEIGDAVNPQLYGMNLANIRRKLRTMHNFGKPKDSIRIVLFADSIWGSGSLASKMRQYFIDTWGIPADNIDISSACYGGYEVTSYVPCVDGAVIKPNVDLFIFSDVPYMEVRDQLVAKVRKETNADIMIGTWTLQVEAQRVRYHHVVDMAKKYRCELLDINGLLWRKVQDGTVDEYMSGVHLNDKGVELVLEDFKKHFESERYYNEYSTSDISEDIVHLAPELNMPLNENIRVNGDWSSNSSQTQIESSRTGDNIEIEFEGVGIEMALGKGSASHSILIDGVAPSTLNLEYCTPMLGKTYTASAWYFHRFFAAYVKEPFMTENETEVEFEVKITELQRGSANVATKIGYSLSQNGAVLGTGDIMKDSEFNFRNGKILIPAKVYGFDNWLEMPSGDPNAPGSGYVFNVGDTMTFKSRKTWIDTIDTGKTQFLRIAGLKRGKHTFKLTKKDAGQTIAKYVSIYK